MSPNDAVDIARLQFAVTASLHFLFVLLTMGLAPAVAIFETQYAMFRKSVHLRITRYLGQIYLINYALGILTGLVMEFQLGFAWKGLSSFYGNVIGAPIALETMLAFFLESTFLGLWIFGWHRFNRWLHCLLIWLVVITAYVSAFWITVANTWMQTPVGYEVRDGIGYLTDFGAIVNNPEVGFSIGHIVGAAAITIGYLLVGIGAWNFLRNSELRRAVARKRRKLAEPQTREDVGLFLRLMRYGAPVALVGAFVTIAVGFARRGAMKIDQPFKYALFARVDDEDIATAQRNAEAEFGPGSYSPPEWIATASGLMEASGFLFLLVAVILTLLLPFNLIARFRPILALLILLPVLPFASSILGWIYREVGRQPWVVYGELKVTDALSPVEPGLLVGSLAAFSALFTILFLTNWWLIVRTIVRGPDAVQLGAEPDDLAKRLPSRPATVREAW